MKNPFMFGDVVKGVYFYNTKIHPRPGEDEIHLSAFHPRVMRNVISVHNSAAETFRKFP